MKNENRKTVNTLEPAMNANWLQRLGVAGFVFFLVKGLLWVAAIVWVAY